MLFLIMVRANKTIRILNREKDLKKMGTSANQLNPENVIRSTRTVFDLDTFSEVELVKTASFSPASTAKEALERLGGDAEKFLSIINTGLKTVAVRSLASDSSIPFHKVNEDDSVGEVWSGTPADMKAVNQLQLVLAKTIFGYDKDAPIESKRKSKEDAMEMIRSSEKMKQGLVTNAAPKVAE